MATQCESVHLTAQHFQRQYDCGAGNATAAVNASNAANTHGTVSPTGAADMAAATRATTASAGGPAPSTALAPARKLLQGRLNTSPSARQRYQAAEVAITVFVTSESILKPQVGVLLVCTCTHSVKLKVSTSVQVPGAAFIAHGTASRSEARVSRASCERVCCDCS